MSEADLEKTTASGRAQTPLLLIESAALLNEKERRVRESFQRQGGHVLAATEPDWLKKLKAENQNPSVVLQGPATLRAVVRDQPGRTIVHLYNLNIERISSFDDKVHVAENIRVAVRVPFARVKSIRALTADPGGTNGPLSFSSKPEGRGTVVEFVVPRLEISAILDLER
jgi:hypothetical protein